MDTESKDPSARSISELHAQSIVNYPKLNLSENEYVLQKVRRHPIGKISIWAEMGALIAAILAAVIWYASNHTHLAASHAHLPSLAIAGIVAAILIIFFATIAVVATIIYNGNQIYLTNECIIQNVQKGLFATAREQINLVKTEDVAVIQNGILPQILHYGTLAVNTMDSKDPHILTMVANPQVAADTIHNASEQAINANPNARAASSGPAMA